MNENIDDQIREIAKILEDRFEDELTELGILPEDPALTEEDVRRIVREELVKLLKEMAL